MRKNNIKGIWFDTIGINIFNTAILVLVGDNADSLKNAAPKIDKELNTANLVQKCVKKLIEDDYLYDCTLTAPNAVKNIIVFFHAKSPNDVPYETMVHEFHHAAYSLCDTRGINDEETETYLQEYLFHDMLCKVDDYVAAEKKSKRKSKKNT